MRNLPNDVELIHGPVRPPTVPPRQDRLPIYKIMGYTLDISSRFLVKCAVGKGTVAAADELIDGYWRRILSSGNASLRASGRHHFVRGQPTVVMSNHQSLLDIPAMMGAVPGSVRMVTKEELTKVPVWGQALIASGFPPIDRKNREKAIKQLDRAKEMLSKGVNIWISPEGTRARDGKLGAFKKGGFHVAKDLGVPIIPAWIEGAADVIPPDQFVVRYDGNVLVKFGAPIATVGKDIGELMEETRAAILELSGRPAEVDGERRAQNAA